MAAKIDRILIGVNFSPASLHAVDYALELARLYRASLTLLHVMDPLYASGTLHPVTILALKDKKRHTLQRLLAGIAKRTNFDGLVNVRVAEGFAEPAIMDIAAKTGCDLIVVGKRKRTGLKRFFGTSVAEQIVRHTETPVLVVPENERGEI